MEPATFLELCDQVGLRIRRQETHLPDSLEPGLRHLATGASYLDLMYAFRVSHNMISLIVHDTCKAIVAEYLLEVLLCPINPDEGQPVTELVKFLWVNVGAEGGASDAQLFNNCQLKDYIERKNLGLPDPAPLPGDTKNMPYFIIGDETFALRTWLMKPYSRRNMTHEERIFNYQISSARRIMENAFGILANHFAACCQC